MEILQSCTKPLIWALAHKFFSLIFFCWTGSYSTYTAYKLQEYPAFFHRLPLNDLQKLCDYGNYQIITWPLCISFFPSLIYMRPDVWDWLDLGYDAEGSCIFRYQVSQALLRIWVCLHCMICTMYIVFIIHAYWEWLSGLWYCTFFNSSPPGQNGRHFTDEIFRCILVNEIFCILIKISLKFVPNGPINNNPALV